MELMNLPSPGIGSALLLLLFAAFFWFSALGLSEWKTRLKSKGWIPDNLDSAQRVCRSATVACLVFMGIALLPPIFDPLIPIALVALVVVAVWSSRDSLRDLAAGWLIQSEGQVAEGVYVQVDQFFGEVTRIGFRTTTLLNAQGKRLVVPNRRLVGQHVVVDSERWPLTSVQLYIPSDAPVADIHKLLNHAVRSSPWAAPSPINISPKSHEANTWTVQTRVLELRFETAFANALRERVDEFTRKSP